jgi:prepilin-type N-terminal cleavage/methylation domain-containing protein
MVKKTHGFSLIELMVVAAIFIVLMAIAVPQMTNFLGTYKISGAAREIAGQISLARMTAAANFTQAELVVNTAAGTYQVQTCTTKNTATGGCTTWTLVGTTATTAGYTQSLPSGVSFGYGSITTPAGSQTTIAQTTTILFNSRGIAVDTVAYNPTTQDAIYLSSISKPIQYYAVTVSAGGKPTLWLYTGSAWTEM